MKHTFLSMLEWRFATKSFDPTKTVSGDNLKKIKSAIHFTPTSFGLQPYKVYIIESPKIKAEILPHAWNQSQITDSSHLFVFCARTDVEDRINGLFELMTDGDAKKREEMKAYEDMMRGFVSQKGEAEIHAWVEKQTYIAQGFCLAACAELAIDSCPIEGFAPQEVDKILKLPAYLRSSVIVAVGYRDDSPIRGKVRFSEEVLFQIV